MGVSRRLIPYHRKSYSLRFQKCFLRLFLFSLFVLLMAGCSTPSKAPVSSREKPTKVHKGKKTSTHRVVRGDTLYSIAWRYGIGFQTLARWNRLRSPYTIFPGQQIKLYPSPKKRPVKKVTQKKTAKNVYKKKVISKKSPPKRNPAPKIRPKPGNQPARNKSNLALKLHWKWPTQGLVVQRFAKGDPLRKGITISGKSGSFIQAAEAGKIVYAGSGLIGYGKLVIIKHNKNYLSAYGYNRKILIKEGMQVKRGARIAQMGQDSSGRPLLHFEIRRNGAPTDPTRLLPRRR